MIIIITIIIIIIIIIPVVTEQCFGAGNRPSKPDSGRLLIGKASRSALRPAIGRPEGRFGGLPD